MVKRKTKTGGITIMRPTKRFKQAITIKQVGAKPVMTKRGTYFKVGEGLFTKKQVLASRKRYARIRYNIKLKNSVVGL